VDVALGERLVQAVLVAEVPVHDGLRDPGLGRDLVHREAGPAAMDDAIGRVEQLFAPPSALALTLGLADLDRGRHACGR
jgi:hypothetical protein